MRFIKRRSRFISTGIKSLDDVLGGGILPGSIVLLAGHPGAGKTTMAAQFLYHGITHEKESGLYVSFAEGKTEFHMHMESLGFDFKSLEEKGLFTFVEGFTVLSPELAGELVELVGKAVLDTNAKRVVLDPITALITAFSEGEARAFFRETLSKFFKPLGITAYFIADLAYGREVIGYGFEEFLADYVLRLEYFGEKPGHLVRRKLIIQKSRYSPVRRYSYDFEIISGHGIKLYLPAEELIPGSYMPRRMPTGIEGLDKMLWGGFLENSIVMLSGPSGSGKTIISLRFAIEGAIRGEKSVYISFEESEQQLSNIICSLGFNPEKLRDNLILMYMPPRASTITAVFDAIMSIIDKYKPKRMVIDGISALERQYSPKILYEIIRMITSLCKSHNITLVLTCLTNILRGSEAGLSTVVDTLIGLDLREINGRITPVIAVLKMRGSPHSRNIGYIEINEGIIEVREP